LRALESCSDLIPGRIVNADSALFLHPNLLAA